MADKITTQPPPGLEGPGQPSGIEVIERPLEERLKPGTPLHAEILSRLNARQQLAERNIQNRYDDWNRVDEHCRLYIDLSRGARRGDKTEDSTKKEMPWSRSLVVPVSYAILWVFLTQLMAIFTRRDPPIEVEGSGPEDVRPAKIMQAVLAYDQQQSNFIFWLSSLIQDSLKYGQGVFYDTWEEEMGWKLTTTSEHFRALIGALGLPIADKAWSVLRRYNKVETIDPYLFWPDPRVPLSMLQDGEFIGHRNWRGYLYLLERSQKNGGPYFNVEDVGRLGPGGRQNIRSRNKFQQTHMALTGSTDKNDKGFHAVDHMQVSLIPREWQLGSGERPEKWWFSWVNAQTIIRAHSSGYQHGKFTYSVAESNPDPHLFANPGSIENLDGLQRFMTWMFNSHIQNVIRHLNNSMIYASSLIEEVDVLNPDAAGHYRLTPLGEKLLLEGRIRMDQIVHQLTLMDVTRPMLQDVNVMLDMALRMSGAADAMQGQTTKDKRTLGEIDRVAAGAGARMSLQSLFIDAMAMRPLAIRMVANRQQFTEEEQYFRIAGDFAREMGVDRLLVKPQDLYGNFDYPTKTSAVPPDPASMAETWVKIMEGYSRIGTLQQPRADGKMLDIHEVFAEAVRNAGVKNLDSFYKGPPPPPQVTVMPDEQVEEQTRQGKVIPFTRGAA